MLTIVFHFANDGKMISLMLPSVAERYLAMGDIERTKYRFARMDAWNANPRLTPAKRVTVDQYTLVKESI